MADYIFNRIEKKYVLTKLEYSNLMLKIKKHLQMNEYGYSTINNIYYDTENFDLVKISIEKPVYKEKIRVRSYGVPNLESTVFLEIKKKYNGIVNKRRISITLKQLYDYTENHIIPNCDKQIMAEIEYCFKKYQLMPKVFVSYDRYAYYDKDDKEFRITFDVNLRSRQENLKLEKGDYGELYSEDDLYIMEVKSLGGMPIWFTQAISELKIYPKSFSKYGNIYKKLRRNNLCLEVS